MTRKIHRFEQEILEEKVKVYTEVEIKAGEFPATFNFYGLQLYRYMRILDKVNNVELPEEYKPLYIALANSYECRFKDKIY